jgi:hypothetical protein
MISFWKFRTTFRLSRFIEGGGICKMGIRRCYACDEEAKWFQLTKSKAISCAYCDKDYKDWVIEKKQLSNKRWERHEDSEDMKGFKRSG